ncbi:MAG: hypothetical protein H6551_10020 [Chitinophagales bacterium]|nr:hypothetical protein [Chitinophagales bacterium]
MRRFSILLLCVMVSCSDKIEELPGKYTYIHEGEDLKFIQHEYDWEKSIYGKVQNVAYNDKFIVVEERPLYDNYRSAVVSNLHEFDKRWDEVVIEPDELKKREIVADSLLKNHTKFVKILSTNINYWIIDVSKDSLLGPYSYEEYISKRRLLEIPNSVYFE